MALGRGTPKDLRSTSGAHPATRLLARLNFSKPVKRAALPSPDPDLDDRVRVSVFERTEAPEEVIEAEARAREQLPLPIIVPDELPARLHRAAQALRKALGSAQPRRFPVGWLSIGVQIWL